MDQVTSEFSIKSLEELMTSSLLNAFEPLYGWQFCNEAQSFGDSLSTVSNYSLSVVRLLDSSL